MKIYLPTQSKQTIGGGWTFVNNLITGMHKFHKDVEFVGNIRDADILFIAGVTLVDTNLVNEATALHKGIIFRVDNIPKKSRNKRGRVYSNMRAFAEAADVVVFQSEWARNYAGYLTGSGVTNSLVIYNGVDKDIFYPAPEAEPKSSMRYLYVQYNRDENKRFPEAAYRFHMAWRHNPDAKLTLVGQFSPELVEAEFDFFAGEDVQYLGVIPDKNVLAEVYRDNDILLFPAFADAAPNTVLEARACGLLIDGVNNVGGTEELLRENLDISLERMCNEYYSLFTLLSNGSHEVKL